MLPEGHDRLYLIDNRSPQSQAPAALFLATVCLALEAVFFLPRPAVVFLLAAEGFVATVLALVGGLAVVPGWAAPESFDAA